MAETPAPDQAVAAELTHEPCRFVARAYWAGQVLAQSSATIILRSGGQPFALAFPDVDVHWDLLRDEGRTVRTPAGRARVFSVDGTAPPPRVGTWAAEDRAGVVNARDAVHRHDATGLVVFDHDRVRVELVDVAPGAADRDATIKIFPVWGDVDDLVRVMDVRQAGDGSWTGLPVGGDHRPVVEASQMLGQALVAAMRQSGGRRPVSAHMVSHRVADARLPLRFELATLSAGRTFTTVAVTVVQDGRPRAAGTLLLDVTAEDVVQHQEPAPACAGPYDSTPCDMAVLGRDIRVAEDAYTDDPAAPAGPPTIDAWVRFRDLPDDPALHVGLLAQFTGHMSIAAALRPHEGVGQAQAHVTLSTGVNALHFALHRDVRMDEWVRYHHHAVSVQGGMAQAENAVYDEAGGRLASFTTASMLRGFSNGERGDGRTAI